MQQIPVYAFTGFLESGKTKFIQETLEDPRFNAGERTLLLVCEEGEEEYAPDQFATDSVKIRVIEDINGNGVWDAGDVVARLQPERAEMYINDTGEDVFATLSDDDGAPWCGKG